MIEPDGIPELTIPEMCDYCGEAIVAKSALDRAITCPFCDMASCDECYQSEHPPYCPDGEECVDY